MDDDAIELLPFTFGWHCEGDTGAACVSPSGDILDIDNFAVGGLLSIPGGNLPIGELS